MMEMDLLSIQSDDESLRVYDLMNSAGLAIVGSKLVFFKTKVLNLTTVHHGIF